MGLFIKCLGQVDLGAAPRNTAHRNSLPPPASAALTLGLAVVWVKKRRGVKKNEENRAEMEEEALGERGMYRNIGSVLEWGYG